MKFNEDDFLEKIGFDKTNSDQEIVLILPIKKLVSTKWKKNRKKLIAELCVE